MKAEEGLNAERIFKLFMSGLYHKEIKAEMDSELSAANSEEMTRILLLHLRIEYLIDVVLREHHISVENLEEAKLTFYQKVRLLPVRAAPLKDLIEPVLCLNQIRNRYVHNLKFCVSGSDIKAINKYLKSIDYEEGTSPIEIIESFCEVAEFLLLAETKMIEDKLKKFLRKKK